MALSTAALVGINAIPSVLKLGANAFGIGKNQPSDYEKKLFKMADIFGSEASKPLTDSTSFKSGESLLNERDEKNRAAIDNAAAVSGSTDEAKLANIQNSNESYNSGVQRLLDFANRQRNRNQQLQLQYLGAGEQARTSRKNQSAANLNAVFDPLSQASQAFTMAELFGGE